MSFRQATSVRIKIHMLDFGIFGGGTKAVCFFGPGRYVAKVRGAYEVDVPVHSEFVEVDDTIAKWDVPETSGAAALALRQQLASTPPHSTASVGVSNTWQLKVFGGEITAAAAGKNFSVTWRLGSGFRQTATRSPHSRPQRGSPDSTPLVSGHGRWRSSTWPGRWSSGARELATGDERQARLAVAVRLAVLRL